MRGDYVEMSVRREVVDDGGGGEICALVVRVWGEADTWADDGDVILIAELRLLAHEPPPAFPPARELIDHVLSTLEFE